MTRIIGGAARGRRLRVPPGDGTRPTADRAREGLFSALAAVTRLAGARVLDLYAGSGAVGLEALSRGAAAAVLVERNRRAAQTCRDNAAAVGLPGAVVVAADVARFVAAGNADSPFDVVFLDPPYDLPDQDVAAVVADLGAGRWCAGGALLVVERSSRDPRWGWPVGIEPYQVRRYGDAALWYGRAAGSGPQAAPGPGGAAVGDS